MKHFINEILLEKPDFKVYKYYDLFHNEMDKIENLAKINFLVGKNSAGKSRFIRNMMLNIDFENWHTKDSDAYLNLLNNLLSIPDDLDDYRISTLEDIGHSIDAMDWEEQIPRYNLKGIYYDIKDEVESIRNQVRLDETAPINITKAETVLDQVDRFIVDYYEEYKYDAIYIPTIRTMKPIRSDNENWHYSSDLKDRTISEYFNKRSDIFSNKIITGQEIFKYMKRDIFNWTDDSSKRNIEEYESIISEIFFENEKIVIVPNEVENTIYLKIGSDPETAIHNLGDGIQSIIILTYSLFMNRNKSFLYFIEEPEVFMHPGFQRKFFDFINLECFNKHQYFITTHSNMFLDLTFDYSNTSIFTFEANKTDGNFGVNIRNVSNESVKPMELLGVRNSSVLLSNCTIWVEGITDRLYIKKYFEIYQKNKHESKMFKEGVHYSFIEYSGNNIMHWSFIEDDDAIDYKMITKNVFLIVDDDNATGAKKERQESLEEHLGKTNYHKLDVLEIENLVMPSILNKVIKKREKLATKVDLSTYCNSENDYKMSKIGIFVEDTYPNLKYKYSSDSGSIYEKLKFAKLAIAETSDFDHLHSDAKVLCEKLYHFIEKSNT